MRRIFSVFLICVLCIPSLSFSAYPDSEVYLISAYYSPLPGQDFYLMGSYEGDIKMNGEGTHTASGEQVRIGTVAAPKEIPFGTRVHIPEVDSSTGKALTFDFHGTVMDRGGAIHSANKIPRLDVYMGSGQAGLCRAINFGTRTGMVTFDTKKTPADTKSFEGIVPAECSDPNKETVAPTSAWAKIAFDPFTMPIGSGSPAENIKIVQKQLARVGAYKGDIDGIYDADFIDAIKQFQLSNGIIKSLKDETAGIYGPKTRSTLKSLVSGSLNQGTTQQPIVNPLANDGSLNTTLDADATRDLQSQLHELGFFPGEPDGIYNKKLVDAIYAFQLAKKIVTSPEDAGAGYYGPVTHSTIEKAYTDLLVRREKIVALEAQLADAQEARRDFLETKKDEFRAQLKKIPKLKVGQIHPEIRTLQKILKKKGFLESKDTAIFGKLTQAGLAKYQVKLKVLTSTNDKNAGILGDVTREAIAMDLYADWLASDTSDQEIKEILQAIEDLKKIN